LPDQAEYDDLNIEAMVEVSPIRTEQDHEAALARRSSLMSAKIAKP